MGLLAKNDGPAYTPPAEDLYGAVCIGVFDLGMQKTQFGNKHQIFLLWEIDSEKDDGSRHTVGRKYSPSLHEKAVFRQLLQSWSGRNVTEQEEHDGFDVLKLLGKPCQLQIIHHNSNGKVYANVGSVTKLGKGMQALKPSKNPVSFTFDDNGRAIPEGVPEWIVKQIHASINWQSSEDVQANYAPDEAVAEKEIPF